jgi:hypothetical protein
MEPVDKPPRRRFAAFAVPMVIGLIAAQRAAPRVRAVDFVLLFASGVAFGVSLMGLIQMWKGRGSSLD